jgi:hypothetical protein
VTGHMSSKCDENEFKKTENREPSPWETLSKKGKAQNLSSASVTVHFCSGVESTDFSGDDFLLQSYRVQSKIYHFLQSLSTPLKFVIVHYS